MKQDDLTTSSIIDWMASPKDPKLTRKTKGLVEELLDNPSQLFSVGALALIREKMLSLPLLLELYKKAYAELLSPTRLAEASTTEIVNICKFVNKELYSAITLAQDASAAQKPRMEERATIKPVNRREDLIRLFGESDK